VLYPIATLQGEHYFYDQVGPANIDGPADPSNEFYKEAVSKIDYVNVANWLTNEAGKDFTFIHPEVLDEKCSIANGKLHLENKINKEDFKVIIVPSCKTISVSNLQKIADFTDREERSFYYRLPFKSVESGKDEQITSLVRSIFPKGESEAGTIKTNNKGGKACFHTFSRGTKSS